MAFMINNQTYSNLTAMVHHHYRLKEVATAAANYYTDACILKFAIATHTKKNGKLRDLGIVGEITVEMYGYQRLGCEIQPFALTEGTVKTSNLPFLPVGEVVTMILDCGDRGLGFVVNTNNDLDYLDEHNLPNFAIPEREFLDFAQYYAQGIPDAPDDEPAPQTPAAPANPVAQATIPQEPAAPTSPNQQQPAQPAAQTQQPVTIGQQSQAYVPPAPTVANNGMSSFGQPDEGNGV